MPRNDLIIDLVKNVAVGDQGRFRRTVETIVAEERAKHHHLFADRLSEVISGQMNERIVPSTPRTPDSLVEVRSQFKLSDLVLSSANRQAVEELIDEQSRTDLLRSYGVEPRSRLFLFGPPGTGKTALAKAISTELCIPLYQVRYEGLITSFLGETAERLSRLFSFVRQNRCILLVDEADAIAKERGDQHEVGEIKRLVSSLLLQIDDLPSHAVVIGASNHPELLDRAIWRRFQIHLEMPCPTVKDIREMLVLFELTLGEKLGCSINTISNALSGLSFAEIQDFCLDVRRRKILSGAEGSLKEIVQSRLWIWKKRRRIGSTCALENEGVEK